MDAYERTQDLARTIRDRGTMIGFDDAQALRRAEMTLHRWAEGECGDSNGNLIERDEVTDKPYLTSEDYTRGMRLIFGFGWGAVPDSDYTDEELIGRRDRRPIADRERGALRRVAEICDRLGLHYYHQGDPRGCGLYVDTAPIPSNDYTRAIACRR